MGKTARRRGTVAALLVVASASGTAQDLTGLARSARSSVVHLRVFNPSGREVSSGTGFFVSADGLVATNHHVIDGAFRIEAVPAEGEPMLVRAVAGRDEINDLALLRLETPASPLGISPTSRVEPGQRIVVLGGPLGLAGSLSEGIVSAIRSAAELEHHHPEASPLLQITAAISPGSSGSPVMNQSGEVVGVVVSQFLGGQNLNFAVPASALSGLMAATGPGSDLVVFDEAREFSRTVYLRNVGISLFFFVVIFLVLRRLR